MSTPGPAIAVYVTINNNDDRLSQRRWINYYDDVVHMIALSGAHVPHQGMTSPTSMWQSACWRIEIQPGIAGRLMTELAKLARDYQQDELLWAEVPETLRLG